MRAFDVFVLSSLGEGISYTMLEAMASGLPVVATRVGGNVELVDEGITGTLVPSSDPAALEAAMEAYFPDRAMAQRHGRAGRAKVEWQFTEEAMVSAYLKTYDRVLARRSA